MKQSYRDRRQRRTRWIAGLLVLLLAAPLLIDAANALKDFGAGLILLSSLVIGGAAYILAGRKSPDKER